MLHLTGQPNALGLLNLFMEILLTRFQAMVTACSLNRLLVIIQACNMLLRAGISPSTPIPIMPLREIPPVAR